MNARSVRHPATERIVERADPRLLRGVRQLALAGLARRTGGQARRRPVPASRGRRSPAATA
ncbi:hypothetical protein [Stenotrophomonas pavanii]|uniref:hypothetical protein n=1 Tax=Stenotrophomonas pavanii TaxID=487698 RepID=UPI002E78C8B0|nr:hypothetical protein [Stenotrophomonas pavanii]